MKNKYVAATLAFFLGWVGVHKLYLGDIRAGIIRILLLLFCTVFFEEATSILWIWSFIEGLQLLLTSKERFDEKYNENTFTHNRPWGRQAAGNAPIVKNNPYIQTGNAKYKEYDYPGAIDDYIKGLAISPNDKVLHFNLACAYSQTEDTDKSIYHLSKAVENGYNDFDTIRTKDDLAFLRVQPEFQKLADNNFRFREDSKPVTDRTRPAENNHELPDLLEQIKTLNQRRENGELSDDEYFIERKKILG